MRCTCVAFVVKANKKRCAIQSEVWELEASLVNKHRTLTACYCWVETLSAVMIVARGQRKCTQDTSVRLCGTVRCSSPLPYFLLEPNPPILQSLSSSSATRSLTNPQFIQDTICTSNISAFFNASLHGLTQLKKRRE